ncbi:MAG: anti-sigma factor antagonist [Bacillota bacterium]
MLKLSFRQDNGWLRASVQGELDVASAPVFRARIQEALDEHQVRRLVLDLRDLTFIDSSGVGAILGRYRQLAALRGEMRVVGVSARIRPVLELSGLGRIVPLERAQGR